MRDRRYAAFILFAAFFLLLYAATAHKGSSAVSTGGGPEELATGFPGFPVDLNTATREDLMILPGIGGVTADRVIALRTSSGGFTDVSELLKVKWLGPAKLERLAPLVAVKPLN